VLPLLFDGHLTLGVAGSSRACSVHRFRASLPRSTDASARTPLVSSKFGLAPCVLRTAVRSCSAYESSSASYAPPVLGPATPFMLQFLVYLALSGRPVFRALHACASPLRRRPKQRSRIRAEVIMHSSSSSEMSRLRDGVVATRERCGA
jgi:hypothetical protein